MKLNDILKRTGLGESLGIKLKRPRTNHSDIYKQVKKAKVYTISMENAILKDAINNIIDNQRIARGESIDFDSIKSKMTDVGNKIKGAFSIKLNEQERSGKYVVYNTVKSFGYKFNKGNKGVIKINAVEILDPLLVSKKVKEFDKLFKSKANQIDQLAKESGDENPKCSGITIYCNGAEDCVAEIKFDIEGGNWSVGVSSLGELASHKSKANGKLDFKKPSGEMYREYRNEHVTAVAERHTIKTSQFVIDYEGLKADGYDVDPARLERLRQSKQDFDNDSFDKWFKRLDLEDYGHIENGEFVIDKPLDDVYESVMAIYSTKDLGLKSDVATDAKWFFNMIFGYDFTNLFTYVRSRGPKMLRGNTFTNILGHIPISNLIVPVNIPILPIVTLFSRAISNRVKLKYNSDIKFILFTGMEAMLIRLHDDIENFLNQAKSKNDSKRIKQFTKMKKELDKLYRDVAKDRKKLAKMI